MINHKAYIAQSKSNKLIKKSSSGGIFAELAKYVIAQAGVVFGCTMERAEEGFVVKHIYIEREQDLYKLQGSKYVQSDLRNTIKEAKDFLDKKRLVLFSGTPCQIAGLKAYLKQDYKNLLTIDLSCTGTPTSEIFNDYIGFLEKKYKQKIINFEFRNKEKMGWSCGNALITFKNGKQKIIQNNLSSYLNLFITKRIQKPNCQNCKFTGLERVSDITLADAWGIDIEYPEFLKTRFDKTNGISLVLVNTEKGINFLEKIQNNVICNEVDINKLTKYNNPLTKKRKEVETKFIEAYKNEGYKRIEKLYKKEWGIKYYYNTVKACTPKFIKSIIKHFLLKQKKVDCLLMTWYHNNNYGSILTAYALQQTINKLGFYSKLIHHSHLGNFSKKFKKHFILTKRCINTTDYLNLNKISNCFILGSDNIINMTEQNIIDVSRALFNYVDSSHKLIMISGTTGAWDGVTKNQKEHDYLKYLLNRFDYISTREEYVKQVFENVFDIKADWINDPVFYLEQQDYINLTKNTKRNYSKNIMEYILYPTEKTHKIIEYYKQQTGLKTVKFNGNDNVRYCLNYKNQSVEDWLSAIINSKLIITDSFHCVAFALIFNKPIICIKNTHNTVRFTSLFNRLGINLSLIETVEDIDTANFNYDKEQVNNKLNDIRNYALNKIKEAILAQKREYKENITMEKYNKEFMKNNTHVPWYKKNRLFYFGIIVPFFVPITRLMTDIKNERNK